MHQKNNAGAEAQSAQIEGGEDEDDELRLTREPDSMLRDPFGDDAEDVDADSDDGMGDDDDNPGWGSHARGSWWRNALSRNREEKFGDGRDDSDSDKDDEGDEEDEEFGDFAMPEKEHQDAEKSNVIVKPLPLHPPNHSQKSTGFTSLWPFSSQGFGSKDREKDKDRFKEGEAERSDLDEVSSDDGHKITPTHEAKARQSIEDPDEEEVVV